MDQWYIPLTLLPGIGLLIMSTSNLLSTLSMEIADILKQGSREKEWLKKQKIIQLALLSRAMVAFYFSCACMIITGLLQALGFNNAINYWILILGILATLVALLFLSTFSIRAVKIRRCQYLGKTLE